MSNSKVLLLVVLAGVFVTLEAKPMSSLQQEELLNQRLAQLDQAFEQSTYKAFFTNKAKADDLERQGYPQTSQLMKLMNQLNIMAESLRYQVNRASVSTVKSILVRTESPESSTFLRNELLIKRAALRGAADSIRFAQSTRNWLHLLVDHYIGGATQIEMVDALQPIVVQIYQRIQAAHASIYRAYKEQQVAMGNYVKFLGTEMNQSTTDHFLKSVDVELDKASGCESCKNQPANGELFNTYPMFEEKFVQARADQVLSSIKGFFESYDRIVKFSQQQIDSVTQEDMDMIMDSVLFDGGLF